MGFLSGILSGVADIVPGGEVVYGAVSGLVGDGGTAVPKSTIGAVVKRCPNTPSAETMRSALANAPSYLVAQLRDAWNRADNGGVYWDRAVTDLTFLTHAIWGGDDCEVTSSAGKVLLTAARQVLSYANDGASIALPPVGGDSVIDRAGDLAGDFAKRVADGVVVAANDTVAQAAQPTVTRVAEQRLFDSLPAIAIGLGIGWLVMRGGR